MVRSSVCQVIFVMSGKMVQEHWANVVSAPGSKTPEGNGTFQMPRYNNAQVVINELIEKLIESDLPKIWSLTSHSVSQPSCVANTP